MEFSSVCPNTSLLISEKRLLFGFSKLGIGMKAVLATNITLSSIVLTSVTGGERADAAALDASAR